MFSMCSCITEGQIMSKKYAITLSTLLSHSVNEISVRDFARLQDDFVVLDAREKNEFEVSKILGARYVGYHEFEIENVKDLSKQSKILVYCSVGYRSEKIAERLVGAGYTDVYNLYGGIFEWKNQSYQVVDSNNEPTERVHAFNKIWGIWLNKGEKVY